MILKHKFFFINSLLFLLIGITYYSIHLLLNVENDAQINKIQITTTKNIKREIRIRIQKNVTDEFPNCIGKTGLEAKRIIEANYNVSNVYIVQEGMMTITDHDEDRVRIWVDGNGTVIEQPRSG